MWNKKPTRCHLVLYLFLLYKLLFISCSTCFWPPYAHLQALTTQWYFFTCGVVPWLCRQSDPVGWLCVHWEVCEIISTKVSMSMLTTFYAPHCCAKPQRWYLHHGHSKENQKAASSIVHQHMCKRLKNVLQFWASSSM